VSRGGRSIAGALAIASLSFAINPAPSSAQGLRTVIESHSKTFPDVGVGVSAIKRDSSGRYFILAKPESLISIYDPQGNRISQIPNAKSNGATIRYAVDIDITPDGLLVVADRGANAILVFSPDGSFVSRTPVVAPTSVVALSGGQFAVTSLTSKRLVQILDQRGKVIRSFGNPIVPEDQLGKEPEKESLQDLGRISGDSAGAIYFAFTSTPDPTFRMYDRYGYATYEASIPEHVFGEGPTPPADRVEFVFGFSNLSFSDQTSAWTSVGSSGDLKFGGGVGTGLNESLRRGLGLGQAAEQQTTLQNGSGGGPFGAMFSGQFTAQGTNFQFGMGSMSGPGGRGRGRSGFGSVTDQTSGQTAALRFSSSGDDPGTGAGTSDISGSSSFDQSSMTAALQSGAYGSYNAETPDQSGTNPGVPAALGEGGLPGAFLLGTAFGSFGGGPGGAPGGFHGGFGGLGGGHSSRFGHVAEAGGRGPEYFPHSGYRGRFGRDSTAFTGGVRVNLGDLTSISYSDKPVITAMAADPETHEIWAGIGDTLVHFSKDGEPMGIYYLALNGSKPLKPVALLVEPNRLLIAADPWGIYEFARPDKPLASPAPHLDVVPQIVPQTR